MVTGFSLCSDHHQIMYYLELKKKLYNPLSVKMEEISSSWQSLMNLVKNIVRYMKQIPYTKKNRNIIIK